VLGIRSFLVAALFLVIPEVVRAQVARTDSTTRPPVNRNGSWSAATSGGQALMGYWTAVLDSAGNAIGTWELIDAQSKTVATGGWSAAKSPDSWTGAWRAAVYGKDGEYLGTWTAAMGGKPNASLADLFQNALPALVGGTWRVDQRSGSWWIRTFK
jgi:hypothetical protein